MILSTQKRLTLEEYIGYDDGTDTRYELVDGVLIEMGAENPINNTIAMFLISRFLQLGIPFYRLANGHQVAVSSGQASARQPDLVVHSEASAAAILDGGTLLTVEMPPPLLVVEVVSNSASDKKSRDRDYVEKRAEYAQRGIPEYWIIDPIAAAILILTLHNGTYQQQQFTADATVVSPAFPQLNLTANQMLCRSIL